MSQNINVTIGLTEQTVVFEGSSDADALAFAQSIGQAITAEPSSVSGAQTQVVTTSGTYFLPSTTNAVVIQTDASTTVVGTGATESVLGGGGNVTFFAAAGSSLNVALGAGADTIQTGAGSSFDVQIAGGGNAAFLNGSGTYQSGPGSGSTIIGGTGSYNISLSGKGDVIALGSGAASVSEGGQGAEIIGGSGRLIANDAGTNDTIVGGTGAETVFGGINSTIYNSISSNLIVASTLAGGADTIIGAGSGSSTVFGGTRDVVFTNQSSISYLAAANGAGTIDGASGGKSTIFGSAGANVEFVSSSGTSTSALLIAGAGAETLTASGSTPVLFGAGSGSDLIGLGSGLDSVEFVKDTTGNVTDRITGFANGDDLVTVTYDTSPADVVDTKQVAGGNTTLTLSDGTTIVLVGYTGDLQTSGDSQAGEITAVCYVTGTRIRTAQGDSAVEDLEIGDLAVTASGETRPIRWIGHRAIDCSRHPHPGEIMPVRVAAHAFKDNCPARDLFVSPGHAICVDVLGEVLIPASALINNTTIKQVEVDAVTYWHVELEGGHDIILAENLPCESYLDMGNRSFFAEAEATALHAVPDARVITHADFCRPFHQDGPTVTFVRERLAARSSNLGWTLEETPMANLHLVIDGKRLYAETSGLCARFLMPASAEEVWLVSDTSVPAEVGIGPDLRALGVCVGSIVIDDGFGAPRAIKADHPLISVGFHSIEEGPQRWTAGRSRLPSQLWEDCRGSFFLRVELTRPAVPKWVAPKAAVSENVLALAG